MRKVLAAGLLAALAAGPGIATAQDGAAPHWAYFGVGGPASWGTLSPDYAACATGRMQSPIDIPSAAPTGGLTLAFDYRESAVRLENSGHALEAAYEPGSTLTVDGTPYRLLQFHLHVPSEHTVDRAGTGAELHLVHAADDGALAVVAVLFDIGADSDFLARFWDDLPEEGETAARAVAVNVADLIDRAGAYYTYVGSLTTPPCTEGVRWIVMAERRTTSVDQLSAYAALLGFNARPVQPLGEREIGR